MASHLVLICISLETLRLNMLSCIYLIHISGQVAVQVSGLFLYQVRYDFLVEISYITVTYINNIYNMYIQFVGHNILYISFLSWWHTFQALNLV